MFARTKRLTLRPGWPEDAPALATAIAHEDVVTKLSRVPWPYEQTDAEGWLALQRRPDDVFCLILAHEQPTPRLVGAIGVHPAEDLGGHELGYWLTPNAWGSGYATEAGQAMLGIARHALGLKRLSARYFLDNPASGNVLRKLGFRIVAQSTQFSRARGREAASVTLVNDLTDEPQSRMAA